jgi:DNA-binding transcriptional LysR family regulator
VVDLVEEGFDLAVRVAPTIDPGLVARKLARTRLVVCASPGYLKKYGVPKLPGDLVHHHCLTYAYVNSPNQWRFRRKGVERKIPVSGALRANSGDILRNAATEGLGVTLQPDFLVFEALRERKLVRILPDWETDELGVFAVYPNRKFLPPKVRNFIDFLVERFAPEPYWHIQGRAS